MARRDDVNQISLFADQPPADAPAVSVPVSGFGGTPDLVAEVLDLVQDGRLAQLVLSSRVVELDGDGGCRHAADDIADVVESLLRQRYITAGDCFPVRHGIVPKNAWSLELTNAGHRVRTRWSHLRGVRR